MNLLLAIIGAKNRTQTFFSQTFRALPGYPGKIPGYPAKKFVFPGLRGTYRTFCPPPLHVEDLHEQTINRQFQKNPRVRKIRVRNSGARNGCANFMDTWKKCVLSAGNPCVHKIPRWGGGGYFGFWGGGGVPILFLFF